MPVTYVNVGTAATSTADVGSLAPGYPASISAGNLLLLACHNSAAAAMPSPANLPSGWDYLFSTDYLDPGSSPRVRQDILYRWADGTETGTVTVTFPSNRDGVLRIAQFAGAAQEFDGTPAIQLGGVDADTTTANPPTIVTTVADCLGIVYNVFSDQRFTSGSFSGATTRYDQGTANGNPRGSLGTSDIASPTSTTYGNGSSQRHVCRTFALSPVALLTPPGAGQRAFGTIIA